MTPTGKWVGRSSATFNSAVIFIPGKNTWHGFDKRPIIGVRRLMEINYVQAKLARPRATVVPGSAHYIGGLGCGRSSL